MATLPARVKNFLLNNFLDYPAFLGLTGSSQQIKQMCKNYKIYFRFFFVQKRSIFWRQILASVQKATKASIFWTTRSSFTWLTRTAFIKTTLWTAKCRPKKCIRLFCNKSNCSTNLIQLQIKNKISIILYFFFQTQCRKLGQNFWRIFFKLQ